jgi:spermidine synthase
MLIYLIVLLEGFVTISFEILTIRQLIPIVGNSVVVTSLIIGVFLLFLAYGYRKGGSYQKDHTAVLKKNFILAALGLGVGLSYIFMSYFFSFAHQLFPHTTLLPLTLYLLLVVAPVVYHLGQTVPITLNLWRKYSSIGLMGGEVLHLSTIGSFLGATLTALLLLNYFGVGWSVFLNFVILIGLALVLTNIKKEYLKLLSICVLSGFIFWINVVFERSFFVTTNNYANYQVKTPEPDKLAKILIINDSYSSYIDDKKKSFAYMELIKKIIFDSLKVENKKILVLGAGGFTLSAEKTNGNEFFYVDIDPSIREIVKEHFIESPKGKFFADDARHFVNTVPDRFDVVVNDTYSNGQAIAAHLLTKEYFAGIKNVLNLGGVAIFNIIARPTLEDAYSKRVDASIRSAFKNCAVIPMDYSDAPTNMIYVCKKSRFEEDKTVYTDDVNNAALDFFTANLQVE